MVQVLRRICFWGGWNLCTVVSAASIDSWHVVLCNGGALITRTDCQAKFSWDVIISKVQAKNNGLWKDETGYSDFDWLESLDVPLPDTPFNA